MKEMLEFLVKHLVDNPEQVGVTEIPGEKTVIYELKVASTDVGKVIGKEGKTAKAIRTLLSAAASKKGKRAVLEILE